MEIDRERRRQQPVLRRPQRQEGEACESVANAARVEIVRDHVSQEKVSVEKTAVVLDADVVEKENTRGVGVDRPLGHRLALVRGGAPRAVALLGAEDDQTRADQDPVAQEDRRKEDVDRDRPPDPRPDRHTGAEAKAATAKASKVEQKTNKGEKGEFQRQSSTGSDDAG